VRRALILLLLASAGATAAPSKDVDGVLLAAMLHDLASAKLDAKEAVCDAARGATGDGSALLAALQKKYPSAISDKDCEGGGPDGSSVKVKKTGGKGVRLDVGPVEWHGDKASVISGGAYRAGGVREVEYTIEKVDGAWKVTSEKLHSQT